MHLIAMSVPFLLTLLSLLLPLSSACTTILVGKRASSSGHPMVTHNNDCTDCDIRIAIVPVRRPFAAQQLPHLPVQVRLPALCRAPIAAPHTRWTH